MWLELTIRFVVGGAIVSLFSLLGEVFSPKTFAGIFGAAPSVAIATLAIALTKEGAAYARVEGVSMLFACPALLVYAQACVVIASKKSLPVWLGALAAYLIWGAVAYAAWRLR